METIVKLCCFSILYPLLSAWRSAIGDQITIEESVSKYLCIRVQQSCSILSAEGINPEHYGTSTSATEGNQWRVESSLNVFENLDNTLCFRIGTSGKTSIYKSRQNNYCVRFVNVRLGTKPIVYLLSYYCHTTVVTIGE